MLRVAFFSLHREAPNRSSDLPDMSKSVTGINPALEKYPRKQRQGDKWVVNFFGSDDDYRMALVG